MREVIFAVALLACITCITIGVSIVSTSGAWIAVGILGAPWAWLVLADDTTDGDT